MVYGQWNFRSIKQTAGFNSVLLQDVCFRSGIALTAMAQHHVDAAGSDLTQLIMNDAGLAQFVDPLSEGVGIIAVGGLADKLKKYGMQLFTGAQAFHAPAMYAARMAPLAKFGIRFSCAFAWYNLDNIKSWLKDRSFENHALHESLYRAILRMGVFELEGYVTGKISRAIYKHVGADRVYAVENATMGIVSPALLAELVDVCTTWFLMQRHPVVEKYVAKFSDRDIHIYNNRWYWFHMIDAYSELYPNGGGPEYSEYMRANERLFLEYSALYYVFGAVGRHWARKGAQAHIDALSAGVCKAGMKLASYVCSENEMYLIKHSREIFIDFLQGMIQDVMHTAGSPQRAAAIDFMRSNGMIPTDLQDDQLINDHIMQFFIDYFYSMGLFDYKQATECVEEYKKNKENLVDYVPYLVDKVGHGILIYATGHLGRWVGYKVAERFFFRKPAAVEDPRFQAQAVAAAS